MIVTAATPHSQSITNDRVLSCDQYNVGALVRHAYLVMAHTQFDTLEKLLTSLDDEHNDIFLHVDSKARDFDAEYFKGLLKRSQLTLTPRMDIRWATFSVFDCELALLRVAAGVGGYGYYHLLSGMDMPIKNQQEIRNFFDRADGAEFIHYFPREHWKRSRVRLSQYHPLQPLRSRTVSGAVKLLLNRTAGLICTLQRVFRVDRLRREDFEVRSGEQWFSITDAFVRYLLDQEGWIRRKGRSTLCADEVFVQTVAANSDFRDRVTGRSMRLIEWPEGSAHPHVWTTADLPRLTSSDDLFARKFNSSVDVQIIDRIHEMISSGTS